MEHFIKKPACKSLLIFGFLCLFGIHYTQAQDRAYTTRFETTLRGGNVIVAGNTNINVGYRGAPVVSEYIDIDGDATTFNSSSEDITIPAGAKVVKAYLYWHSSKDYSANYSFSDPNLTKVLFKTPSTAGYVELTPDVIDVVTNGRNHWQAIKDVTTQIQSSGTVTVANIKSQPIPPNRNGFYLPYAGWSLIVIFSDPNLNLPYRIQLVDGFQYSSSGSNNVPMSGFLTPTNTAIPLVGEVGWFVGQANVDWGDGVSYQNTTTNTAQVPFSDALNPLGNVLNETRSYKGAAVANPRNPATGKSYGMGSANTDVAFPWFDLDVVDISNYLTRGQSSLMMRFFVYGTSNNCTPLPSPNPYWGCGDWNAPGYLYARIRTAATITDPKNQAIPQPTLNSTKTMADGLPIFTGVGPEGEILPGTGGSMRILSLPDNGELYYDYGAGPIKLAAGVLLTNFSPTLFSIKFTKAGTTKLSFDYAMIGSGVEDTEGAPYEINWPSALPVVFGDINARIENAKLWVNWTVNSETENDHFIIEISKDGKDFKPLATLKSLAPGGNTSTPMNYSYSADLADLAALLAIPSLLFGLLLSTRKRKWLSLFLLLGLGALLYGCLKSTLPVDTSYQGKIQVRIVQVNKDGTKATSKVRFLDHQP